MTTDTSAPITFTPLTFKEIVRSAEGRLTRFEMPDFKDQDGNPMVVFFRELSAAEVMDFADLAGNSEESKRAQKEIQYTMLAKCLANADGSLIVPPGESDRIRDIPISMFSCLIRGMTKAFGMDDVTVTTGGTGGGKV